MKNHYIIIIHFLIWVDFKISISCRFYNCKRLLVKIKILSSANTPITSEHAMIFEN